MKLSELRSFSLEEARLSRNHGLGKPCPIKPWMTPTTLDYDRGKCGACGTKLVGTGE